MKRILLFVILFATTFAYTQVYQGEKLNAVFRSEAKLNNFEGVSSKLNGLIDLEKNLVDFYVDLTTLDTGIKLRDKHMRDDYLETKKYPFAEFTGSFSEEDLEKIKNKQSGSYIVKGNFEVHGVQRSREIELSLVFNQEKSQLNFETTFNMKLTDHDIEIPKLMFYELSNDIKITANGILKNSK